MGYHEAGADCRGLGRSLLPSEVPGDEFAGSDVQKGACVDLNSADCYLRNLTTGIFDSFLADMAALAYTGKPTSS